MYCTHFRENMAEIMEEDKVSIKVEIKKDVNEESAENRGMVKCFIYIYSLRMINF